MIRASKRSISKRLAFQARPDKVNPGFHLKCKEHPELGICCFAGRGSRSALTATPFRRRAQSLTPERVSAQVVAA